MHKLKFLDFLATHQKPSDFESKKTSRVIEWLTTSYLVLVSLLLKKKSMINKKFVGILFYKSRQNSMTQNKKKMHAKETIYDLEDCLFLSLLVFKCLYTFFSFSFEDALIVVDDCLVEIIPFPVIELLSASLHLEALLHTKDSLVCQRDWLPVFVFRSYSLILRASLSMCV